jgi:hypothetical protein
MPATPKFYSRTAVAAKAVCQFYEICIESLDLALAGYTSIANETEPADISKY